MSLCGVHTFCFVFFWLSSRSPQVYHVSHVGNHWSQLNSAINMQCVCRPHEGATALPLSKVPIIRACLLS